MSFHGDLLKDYKRLLQLLRHSSSLRSLRATQALHGITFTTEPLLNETLFMQNNVLFMYNSLDELYSARKLFDQMAHRNVVSYNTLIGAYSKRGCVEEAWELFSEMKRRFGISPTEFTFGGLLSCESLDIRRGVQLHGCVVKNGLFCSNAFVGTSLFGFYGRLRFTDKAVRAFEDMPRKSLVTWNAMMSLLSHHGFFESCAYLFRELVRTKAALSECSLSSVLSGFSSEEEGNFGEIIHVFSVKLGLDCSILVGNSLINMYSKCLGAEIAEKVFEEMSDRDVVTWNSIIGATARSERPGRAFDHFLKMSISGVLPNSTTYANLISCCTALELSFLGETIHGKVIRNGMYCDVYVGTALVDFYGKCDNMDDAHQCFQMLSERNVFSWNALISCYANKCSETSLVLLREMLQFGFQPNEFTISVVLKSLSALELCQVHCLIIRMGYQDNAYVLSLLITSYARNGFVVNALAFVTSSSSPLLTVPFNITAGLYNRAARYDETVKLLSQLDEPDRVSWNILIEACARSDCHEDAVELLNQMSLRGIFPDNFTFVSLLSVSATSRNLALGSALHGLIMKMNFRCRDSVVCNALMDMYRRCGNIASASKVFDETNGKTVIMCTTLISALSLNGNNREALERYREMELLGIKPDSAALNAVLTACRHGGLVDEGRELFRVMKAIYGIEPGIQHYHNVVDLLAKTGHTREAKKVISEMPFPPNAMIWRSLFQDCNRDEMTLVQTNRYSLVNVT